MANRVVEILYSLKDKFTGQVRKITAGYKNLGDSAEKAGDRLERAHRKAHESIGGLGAKVAVVGRNIATGFTAAAAAISALAFPAKRAAEEFDQLAKQADKVGLTTDALQELRFAGQRTGIGIRAVDVAMQRFSRRVAEVANGSGVLKKEFDRLGISVRGQNGELRATEAILRDYADAIQNTAEPQEQLRLAFAAFDTEGAAMVNTLRNGSKGLDEFGDAAREAGQVVEEELLRSAEEINDRFDELSDTISLKFKKSMVELGGVVSRFFARFDIGGNQIRNLEVQLQALAESRDRLEKRGDPLSLIKADEVNAEIFKVMSRLDDLRGKADGAAQSLENIKATGVAKLRRELDAAAASAAGLFKETKKLFEEKPKDPLDGLDSTAARVSRAYSLVGDALSQVRVDPDSEDAARNIEKAAAAINQLKESGDIADDTIARLKATLKTALDQRPVDDLKIVPTIDENGVRGFTDEATQKLQAELNQKKLIVPAGIDVETAKQDMQSIEKSFNAMADRMRLRTQSILSAAGSNLLTELEKRGVK